MTSTLTLTQTFTITEARYITSKIAADLDSLRLLYGKPEAQSVTEFAEEAAILLSKRSLKSVEYGFKKNDVIIFSLRYEVRPNGTLEADDRPGKIPYGLDMNGATFYSYLRYSDAFNSLPAESQLAIENLLPFQRNGAGEPTVSQTGQWVSSRTYSKNGEGVERLTFKQYGS
jgi:Bacterial HORMA domain family 1